MPVIAIAATRLTIFHPHMIPTYKAIASIVFRNPMAVLTNFADKIINVLEYNLLDDTSNIKSDS